MDPARLITSKGALLAMALTVSGQESVIQKYANAFSEPSENVIKWCYRISLQEGELPSTINAKEQQNTYHFCG